MIVKTFGSAIQGVDAITITIEVNVSSKGNKLFIVGLPDNFFNDPNSLNRLRPPPMSSTP